MKVCNRCGKDQPKEDFHVKRAAKDGCASLCKSCVKIQKRLHYLNNIDKIKRQKKDYRRSLPPHKKEARRRYFREYQRKLRKTNKLARVASNYLRLLNHSIKNQGFTKKSKTAAILGCTFEELQNHLWTTFEENYGLPRNWVDESLLHIDHIIPVSTATTEEEVIKLNHYTNLQYLLAEDNMEKSDKVNWELKLL